ncbi:hypothetical protein EV363DRAFT_1425646 [Boletus edulis]|nr:hypothetical protein EV363DRAFT_1425646 [Boletus edulis]
MPARSRTKSASKDVQARSKEKSTKSDDTVSDIEKENRSRAARTRSKAQVTPSTDTRHAKNDTYCLCNQPDDGSPMVCCSECSEWFHFRCVKLSVQQAEDLEVFVCPTCTENTGRRMIMQWEGPEAHPDFVNVLHDDDSTNVPIQLPTPPPALSPSESEEDLDSEDEYVAEPETVKGRRPSKRRTRHAAYASDSDHSDHIPDTRKFSTPFSEERRASPATSTHLKRKPGVSHQGREPKRKKSSDAPVSVDDDPARKYCLGKLRDMFRPVFIRYPHADTADASGNKVDLKAEDLTDEDKQRLQNEADVFASELEQCLFELYGEPDKHGKQGVGPKYKERFRMATFNLSQADRVAIHKRICYATISAKELSQMSSTDLANEETKQSIKLAEIEALEHSILQKTLVPRAKITHKGLQDIEDVNGESPTLLREREKEREKEDDERREEERRERERQARLKAAEQHQRDRASSISQGSIPPESPIVPQSATWGGSFPMHHDSYSPPASDSIRPPVHPLFAPSASDLQTSPEPELDITDLIHLDDEPAPQDSFGDHLPTPALEASVMPSAADHPTPTPLELVPLPPLTIPPSSSESSAVSPTQLVKPETPARPSFNLNTLWSSPKTEPSSQEIAKQPEPEQEQEHKSHPIEVDAVSCMATDQDFDMFLEKDQEADGVQDERPRDPEAAFQAAPLVWIGKVAMPVDSSIPQVAPVVARQVGGRTLGADSPLWRTLFPSDMLRIDGRVPIENSAQFLLQTRLNPQKELIACAFSPEGGDSILQTFSDFLLHKNRHGLVFPWGHQPKDYHPGKELYIVPLLASSPLPDFIELLDELRLPKVRQNNYVIGIWILIRGKLAPSPAMPPAAPLLLGVPQPSAPAPVPSLSAALQAFPQLANSALAAEVAALTPEQIQGLLRALSSGNGGIPGISGGLANAVANVAHVPHPPPQPHPLVPPTMPTGGAPPVPQWPGFPVPSAPGSLPGPSSAPSPGTAFPPASAPGASTFMGPPHTRTPPRPGMSSPHGLAGIHQPTGPRAGGGEGERPGGWQPSNGRGRGRGRARGRSSVGGERGGAAGGVDFMGRPVDAGWARQRAGAQGAPGPEDRGRWDGPSPPRRWG